ncbi:hypothetical protein H1C71_024172, partial [Ictidomys tridecemlineatus]
QLAVTVIIKNNYVKRKRSILMQHRRKLLQTVFQSEDSDSGEDFLIGKARWTPRKESSFHSSAKEQKPLQQALPKEDTHEAHWNIRSDQKIPSTEARKLESVFLHSLSGSKISRRDYRQQAPKNKTPDFLENKPQIDNQF